MCIEFCKYNIISMLMNYKYKFNSAIPFVFKYYSE